MSKNINKNNKQILKQTQYSIFNDDNLNKQTGMVVGLQQTINMKQSVKQLNVYNQTENTNRIGNLNDSNDNNGLCNRNESAKHNQHR